MRQPRMRHPFVLFSRFHFAFALLALCFLAGCSSGGTGSGTASIPTATPTPAGTPTPPPTPPPTPGPFSITSIDLTVTPGSIAGMPCGSSVSLTYTATFHIPANTPGGVIKFEVTTNNGRSSGSASVTAGPGETTKTYTFTSSGTLRDDHTYPGIGKVWTTSPNSVYSPGVIPSGSCGAAAPFQVTSVSMSVNPSSIAGLACGTQTTITYTATFHIAAGGPGGTIQFDYSVNNGRSQTPTSITVAAGQTAATYSFTWSGKLPSDHTYPEGGGVVVNSPNQVNSSLLAPTGSCS